MSSPLPQPETPTELLDAKPTPKNGLFSLMDQSLVSGTRFLVTIMVAKACGEVVLGVYALTLSLVLMALMVQQTLVTTPYSNFRNRMSRKDEANYYHDSWFLSLSVSTLSSLLLALTGLTFWVLSTSSLEFDSAKFPVGKIGLACFSAACAVPFMISAEFFRRTWLIRMQASKAFCLDALISAFVIGILGSLFWLEMLSETTVFFVLGGVNLIAAIVAFRILLPGVKFSKTRVKTQAAKHWGFGKWIFSSEAMLIGRGQIIMWIIGGFLGIGATGFYSACDSLMRTINPFFLGVASVAEPTLAAGYAKAGRKEVKRIAYKVLAIMMLGTLPICLGVSLLSYQLLNLLYGPTFAEYSAVVVWLAAGAFINSNSYPFSNSIQAIDRPEINFRIRALTFSVVVIGAFFVTPIWGLWGVAALQCLGTTIAFTARWLAFNHFFSDQANSQSDHELGVS